jgi:hypothetical protein
MMILTPIHALVTAADLGITLGFEPPDTLTFSPAKQAPKYLVEGMRHFKTQLLALLQLPFALVDSKAVGEILFFCEDELTKNRLTQAGASTYSIYTRAELEALVAANRIAPISAADLFKLHEIKKTYDARITL